MAVSRGSRLVVLLAAILAACSATKKAVTESNQLLFQYNRQREEWERIVPRDTMEISQKKLAGMRDAPPAPLAVHEVQIEDLNQMKDHLESGGNLKVAGKHQLDGTTVFRSDMHEQQLLAKSRDIRNQKSQRIDPHSAFQLALNYHKERKNLFPALYHAVIHSNPEHFSAYFNMASWLHSKGNPGEARDLFEVAHRLLPLHVLPQVSLTELYAQTGNLPQALLMLTKLPSAMSKLTFKTQVDSENAPVQKNLRLRMLIATSILLQQQGLFTDAQREYQKIIEEFKEQFRPSGTPNTHFAPIIWYNYGIVCHQLGQEKDAKKLWQKAVDLMPNLAHFLPHKQKSQSQMLTQPMHNQPMWPLWGDVLVDGAGEIVYTGGGAKAKLIK